MCCFSTTVHAQTSPDIIVDVSANGGIETNPFLGDRGQSSLTATLQVDPQITWKDETSSVGLTANLRISQYSRGFGNDVGGAVGVQTERAFNDRTSLSANAGLRSARLSVQDFLTGDQINALGPISSPVVFTDLSAASRRTRVTSANAYIGVDQILDENSSVNLYGTATYSQLGSPSGNDFRTVAVGTQYRRTLTERISATAGATATQVDYVGISDGDAKILSPQIGLTGKVSERLNWTAALGVSIASINAANGITTSKTYLNGSFSLCRSGVSSSLCASIARSTEPTLFGGISSATNVAVNYDQRLTSKGSLALAGRYGQTNQGGNSSPLFDTNKLLGLSASYTHRLNDRISLFAASTLAKAFTRRTNDATNYSFLIGLKIRLGKLI